LAVVLPIFEEVAKGVAERDGLEKVSAQEEAKTLVVLLFRGVTMRLETLLAFLWILIFTILLLARGRLKTWSLIRRTSQTQRPREL
jgi:hypothetical protein